MPELLQNFLARSAERFADSPAVICNQVTIGYSQLEQTTNQLARLLRAAGCKQGDRVCFLVPKCPLAILCMLGVLKADSLHVPLDTASPAARLAKILRSCRPRVLLAAGPVSHLLQELFETGVLADTALGWMDTKQALPAAVPAAFSFSDLSAYSTQPPTYANGSHSPSHILFTSGSTGIPKGVVLTHANVIHFVKWATKYFSMDSSDRISGHSPLHFDLSQFDIFGAFAVGAQLHLVPPELNLLPSKTAAFIRNSELTQWFSVPSALHYMAKFDAFEYGDFPLLKRVLWCGETLATPVLIHWMSRLPHVSFTNLYGPTETTIASSYYTVPACPADPHVSIPIGFPCEGEELLVLDSDKKQVPTGEVGRLYIRGVGLSPGYWEDDARTRAVFLEDVVANNPFNRIYDTGDLAKVGEDGSFYFLGRTDSQIKSRGYRIELGEIEAALNTIAFLRECAVVAVPSSGFEGTAICCAYSTDDAAGDPAAVRECLARLLPSYMLPTCWMMTRTLPKNSNGKVDRSKIREQFRNMAVLPPGSKSA